MNNNQAMQLKEDFPILKREIHGKPLVYLDNAATTQKPQQVIGAITRYYQEQNANVPRGVYRLSEEATELYDGAHKAVADFINAKPQEIIFTKNTTDSINILA
ncbi:MAG: aminotransferase class V-fold PLP-dependent enzyme, partial [Nanoarchaeota archaeon]